MCLCVQGLTSIGGDLVVKGNGNLMYLDGLRNLAAPPGGQVVVINNGRTTLKLPEHTGAGRHHSMLGARGGRGGRLVGVWEGDTRVGVWN